MLNSISNSSKTLTAVVLVALNNDRRFNFYKTSHHLISGRCPMCGRNTVTTLLQDPTILRCSRNACYYLKKTSELYPELYKEIPSSLSARKVTPCRVNKFTTLVASNNFIDHQLEGGFACSRVKTENGFLVTTLTMLKAG